MCLLAENLGICLIVVEDTSIAFFLTAGNGGKDGTYISDVCSPHVYGSKSQLF